MQQRAKRVAQIAHQMRLLIASRDVSDAMSEELIERLQIASVGATDVIARILTEIASAITVEIDSNLDE